MNSAVAIQKYNLINFIVLMKINYAVEKLLVYIIILSLQPTITTQHQKYYDIIINNFSTV